MVAAWVDPDAARWREWVSDVAASLVQIDGEGGLEFCEGAGLLIVDELKNRQPETGTVSELIVVAVMTKLHATCAEAYVDLKRPWRVPDSESTWTHSQGTRHPRQRVSAGA